MPNNLNIWYCTDNCGTVNTYRKGCALHFGVALEHIALDEYNDGRREIYYNAYCKASHGNRQCTLRKERVDKYGDRIE